jgi:prepilin-type N-terminal cleavage/methylation domain-containing protein
MGIGRERRGFTLLELVLALVIGSIVMVSIYYGVIYFFGQISRAEAQARLRRDADIASRWIELGVRGGTWAYLETDAGGSLSAEHYRNGTLQWHKDIYLDGTNLVVDSGGSQETPVSNLAALNFQVHPARVEYSLTAQVPDRQYSLSSAVRLRNPRYSGVWHFSRTSGRVAYDDSSRRNHALITGCSHVTPTDSDWDYGPVLAFGGETAGDHLRVPSNPGLDSSKRLSFSAWVKLSSSAANDMTSTGTRTLSILNRNGESTAGGGFFHMYLEAGQLCYAFDSGGSRERAFSDLVSWQADQWYELLVQNGGPAGGRWVRFYRDGKLIGKASVGDLTAVTAGDLYIGAYNDAGTLDGMWQGQMDEVRYSTF